MTVVQFPVKHTKLSKQEEAWEKYAAAAAKAQGTLRVADGIAAGKAWSEFMKLFASSEGNGAA